MYLFLFILDTNNGDNMILDYEISFYKGEEVLMLYLSYQYEFSSFTFHRTDFQEEIRHFFKKKGIVFHGNLVLLVIGGIVIGKIYLSSLPSLCPSFHTISKEDDTMVTEDISSDSNAEVLQPKTEEAVDSNSSNFISSTLDEAFPNEVETSLDSDSSFYEDSLEEYVIGVVAAEMPASFSEEALKAQAILARTYAIKLQRENRSLTGDNKTQNYKSNEELRSLWTSQYDSYYWKIHQAVYATKGLYLTYQGEVIDCVYHSTSNGKTENSKDVWGGAYPYLVSVDSPYDVMNPSFQKDTFFSYSELSDLLSISVTSETTFSIIEKTESGRIATIEVDGNRFQGTDFRNKLHLRSTDFEFFSQEGGILIRTRGYGHGVGMSQYGANGMAIQGSSYEDILLHYYPGVSINHL